MTKKNLRYIKSNYSMSEKEHSDIKAEAERLGMSINSYLISLHYNNQAMKDSKKEPVK